MAQTDYLLELEGIEGETGDTRFPKGIDILSFTFGMSNMGTHSRGGGGGAGVVDHQDISFVKEVDKASPKLMEYCSKGTVIKNGTLHVRKQGGGDDSQKEYYTITLEDCLISNVQNSAGGGGIIPNESFSLNYSRIKFEYRRQKEDGELEAPITYKWNLKTNKTD